MAFTSCYPVSKRCTGPPQCNLLLLQATEVCRCDVFHYAVLARHACRCVALHAILRRMLKIPARELFRLEASPLLANMHCVNGLLCRSNVRACYQHNRHIRLHDDFNPCMHALAMVLACMCSDQHWRTHVHAMHAYMQSDQHQCTHESMHAYMQSNQH